MTRARGALVALLTLLTLVLLGTAPSASAASPSPAPDGELINARVRVQESREDIAGVTVRVLRDGETVAQAATGPDGIAALPVPDPGDYDVEVDLSTLPDELADLTIVRNPFPTTVGSGTPRTVAFQLVTADVAAEAGASAGGGIAWNTAPQLFVSGLRFGLLIALAALGLSLVFGTTGLTNFAHGELVTLGALVTYSLNVVAGLPLLVAIPITLVLAGGFGWLQDRFIWGQLRRRGVGLVAMMIFSIGFSFFLRYVLLYIYGGEIIFYGDFSGQRGLDLGPVILRPSDLISMAVSVVLLVLVAVALLRTRIGKATRAVSDNPALAASSGIDVDGVIRVVWIAGTALAALSGILLGLAQGMDFQLGFAILLLIFAAVTLGGLGTAFGAILGSLAIGLLLDLSTLFIPAELRNVGALVVLILILLVRPQGFLGRRERIG